MIAVIFRLFGKLFPTLAVLKRNAATLAFGLGQWKSVKQGRPVDANGLPIPWYTYPAIEYLSSFDFARFDVFEFGSGNSSMYWAARVQNVVSVEDDYEWFKTVNSNKLYNQTIIFCADEDSYVGALLEQRRDFEIIIIDGKHRKRCVLEAVNYLKDGGLLVLDNSERVVEKECAKFLREQGFIQIDFNGFGPINNYCWTTSLFMKKPDLLQVNYAGPLPIGGLH